MGPSRINDRKKCHQPKIQSFIRFGRCWVPLSQTYGKKCHQPKIQSKHGLVAVGTPAPPDQPHFQKIFFELVTQDCQSRSAECIGTTALLGDNGKWVISALEKCHQPKSQSKHETVALGLPHIIHRKSVTNSNPSHLYELVALESSRINNRDSFGTVKYHA